MGETRLCLAALEVLSSSLAKEFSLGVLTNAMGGHQRLWHPKWWSRYVWGYFASMQLACFASEQWYGIDRSKNPDQLWPWWNEIMQKKKNGEIPATCRATCSQLTRTSLSSVGLQPVRQPQ